MAPSPLPPTLDEARGLFAVDGRPLPEDERVEVTTAQRKSERDALGRRERIHRPPILLPQHVDHATHARPILTVLRPASVWRGSRVVGVASSVQSPISTDTATGARSGGAIRVKATGARHTAGAPFRC